MFIPHKGGNSADAAHLLPFTRRSTPTMLVVVGATIALASGIDPSSSSWALSQAAGNDQFLALFRQPHQRAHRLLAGVLDGCRFTTTTAASSSLVLTP